MRNNRVKIGDTVYTVDYGRDKLKACRCIGRFEINNSTYIRVEEGRKIRTLPEPDVYATEKEAQLVLDDFRKQLFL